MSTKVAVSGLGTGLASQIDSKAMIDKLVAIATEPVTTLQTEEADYKTQISTLATLSSALATLQSAAKNLGKSGVLGVTASVSDGADYTATPSTGAVAGSFDIEVDALAKQAKWRSGGFAPDDVAGAGHLALVMDGTDYGFDVTEGSSLTDVLAQVRQSGAPVSASILNDGTRSYLSITATQGGYAGTDEVAGPPTALEISFALDPGATGLDPSNGSTQVAAANASFSIDGLPFTRRTNAVSDALPGTTLTLRAATKKVDTLALANDTATTATNIQSYVAAYNALMTVVQAQVGPQPTGPLQGDSMVYALKRQMQGLASQSVAGLSYVNSLASLGVTTTSDGSLSLDSSVLAAAMQKDPSAVDAIFADPSGGIGKLTSDLVDGFTSPSSGQLTFEQKGITQRIGQLDDQIVTGLLHVQSYQDELTLQFAAMQSVLTNFQSVSDYLTMLSNANNSKS